MDSSPGFASAPGDSNRRLNDSPSLRLASELNLAAGRNSLAHSTKGTPSHREGCSGCLGAHGFRCSFTPLSGCFSPFPHGTGSLSVMGECSALEGGPPCFGPGFTCPALLGDAPRRPHGFRVRGSHPLRPAFPCRSASVWLCDSARESRLSGWLAPQPPRSNALSLARARVWALVRFRSPLLPESRLISFPRGT